MTTYRYGYVRVSTLRQDPAGQLDAMAAAGIERSRVFVGYASGGRDDRLELAAVLGLLRPGDTLLVWRLDWLGRSMPHLTQSVTELGERGIGFCSLTEAIDTTTAGSVLFFGIMASLAEFERRLIRERTMAGLAAALSRGKLGGRPAVMTPKKIEVAQRMLNEGQDKAVITRTIGVSRPTLYNFLAG